MSSSAMLALQVCEGSSLVTCHLLELQQNLLLGEVRIVCCRHLLERIGYEIEIERAPRLERAPIRELDHIGHERLCKGVLELRNPSHGRCRAFFSSLKFFDAEFCQLLPQSGLPLLEQLLSHNSDIRKEVAFHPAQLIGNVRLHLSNGELLAHRNEVLPLFVVAQMLLPESLTDEKLVSSKPVSCLNPALDSMPRSKSHFVFILRFHRQFTMRFSKAACRADTGR